MQSSDPWAPLLELFKSWKINNEKYFSHQDPVMKELGVYSQELSRILKAANKDLPKEMSDLQTITVAIRESGQDKPKYSAKIRLDGDWIEEVPSLPPSENDIYWTRFRENVNKVRDERKEITNKAIEVAGNSISRIITPISFSPEDITNVIQLLRDSSKK
jgi:hypothetical protein